MTDRIAVIGNLTSPPERRSVAGGVTMVTFGLASTERRLENGVWVDAHTNFYNVSVFRRLAEHAYTSLEKGQRVIIQGKLKLRAWEANGRTGTSIDLEASSLGPDLLFGIASFVKDASAAERGASSTHAGDEWAPEGAVDTATGEFLSPTAGTEEGNPALVAAGDWGAPPPEEVTPF